MSEVGKFSQVTSVIIATMVELAQRMLTKRPTVARVAETPSWLAARSPTRARDPRTEITRPKEVVADVTVDEPGRSRIRVRRMTMEAVAGETVKPAKLPLLQICRILVKICFAGPYRPACIGG